MNAEGPFVPKATAAPLTLQKVRAAYERWAPIYDEVFGACFRPGQQAAVQALAPAPGDRVLEVGVGTGLALSLWPRLTRVTGIDISERMLRRAARQCERHRLNHVELRLLDAQATGYPDNSFDKIAAMYVVSVVPSAPLLLAEMQRICRPGGRIAIVNHFAQSHPLLRRMEHFLADHAALLGFNTATPAEIVTRNPGLRVLGVRPVNWGGYWTLIEAENVK